MLVFFISSIASYFFSLLSLYPVSALLLFIAAIYLYIIEFQRTKTLVNLRGIFSASFVGGEAVACLKLSHLQKTWSIWTWIAFFLAFACFWLAYSFLSEQLGRIERKHQRRNGVNLDTIRLFLMMIAITMASLLAFCIEAYLLGFIPLFIRGVPHAYSTFHITGLHYITVSCVLVPAMSVIYFKEIRGGMDIESFIVIIMNIISLLIPILCVSRFQFIFSIMLASLVFVAMRRETNQWILGLAGFGIFPIYILLTYARSHNANYLNTIFEMKYNLPVFIGQPYTYIANNYENFNCLVEQLPQYTWGMKGLFPLWALTGLKFIYPNLVDFPIYITKTELTTLTLFYDAYYDFGMIGIILFSTILGIVSYFVEDSLKESSNPISYLYYAQLSGYFGLSFFTTWFSNPTTWYYFILTGIVYIFCAGNRRRKRKYRSYRNYQSYVQY